MFLLSTIAWSAEPCEEPVRNDVFSVQVDAASKALEDSDFEGFVTLIGEVETSISCLTDPIEPPVAAAVLRLIGVKAFAQDDPERATAAFAGARSIEPDAKLALYPDDHEIYARYVDRPSVAFPHVRHGTEWAVNGRKRGRPRTSGWSILQYRTADGLQSKLWDGNDVPYPRRRNTKVGLRVAAIGTTALAVAGGALMVSSDASFGQSSDQADADRHLRTNRLGGGLAVTGAALTVGLLTTSFVVDF